MKLKNVLLIFLLVFLLIFNLNTVQAGNDDSSGGFWSGVGDFFEGIGDFFTGDGDGDKEGDKKDPQNNDQGDGDDNPGLGRQRQSDFFDNLSNQYKSILGNEDNSNRLQSMEFGCNLQERGSAQDDCFEQIQLTQILMIDDSDLCSTLDGLIDGCYTEFASKNHNIDICNNIGDNDKRNKCVAIIISIQAKQDNNIGLCDSLVEPYREDCMEGVISIQESISYCDATFIINYNLVDKCKSIIYSGYAISNNDSSFCESVPLPVYQNSCFIELGLFCNDGICTNVFEDIASCPGDCIVCGDNICTASHENIASCPGDCIVCGDNICTASHENIASCAADCSVCGDGDPTGDEVCDDGSTYNGQYGYCNATCSAVGFYCGDTIVNDPPELCEQDQGPLACVLTNNYNGEKTCNSDCLSFSPCIATEWCGDGDNDVPEQCDNDIGEPPVGGDGCSSSCTVETGWNCDQSEPSNCTEICGDNNIVGEEECDDNNLNNGDGCSSSCTIEAGWNCSSVTCNAICGDGIFIASREECDDNNLNNGDGCSSSCTIEAGWNCSGTTCNAICGDGNIMGNEACDDGNTTDHDACSAICQNETYDATWCGDAILFPGEEACDDGNSNNNDSCLDTCQNASCGDSYLQSGEECDDGDLNNGDGCSSSCEAEVGWNCNSGTCVTTCGNEIPELNFGEECDDGDSNNNDSCPDTCLNASCGDSYVQWGIEECDPNDPVYGSHCSSNCQCNDNSEYCALAKLFYNNNGQNWTNNTNWLSNLPFDQWYGISTNANMVNGLNIANNGISNINSLSNLPNLEYLNIDDNNISDLSSLSSLSNLASLQSNNNNISDLSSLSGLSNLNFLTLANNGISNINSLSNLINLNLLYLDWNNISDISSLNNLINLDSLNLGFNDIENIPEFVCNNLPSSMLYIVQNQLAENSCDVVRCLDDATINLWSYTPQKNGFDFFADCGPVCGDNNQESPEECDPPGISRSGSIFQHAKLTDFNGIDNDYFGDSVAIDGDYIVIGVQNDDDRGINSGSVYIFKRDGNVWSQQQKIIANDGAYEDNFGGSVSIQGDHIVVGAYGDNNNTGSAYIFKRDGNVWSQQQKIIANDKAVNDYFGLSVSIQGDHIVVGAYGDNNNTGSAYIFKRDGSVWSQQQKIVANDGVISDRFATAVDIDGDYVLVGSYFSDVNGNSYSGSAYIFKRDGNVWSQQQKIIANDGGVHDYFGSTLAINGDYVVIGLKKDDDNGSNSGSAYIFKRDGNVWSQQQKIVASDGEAYDHFGDSVNIDGDYIVVGASGDDENGSNSGSAYIFKRDGSIWSQQQKIVASDGEAYDNFGSAVTVSGDSIVIGSPENIDNGFSSGSAYIFGPGCLTTSGTIGAITCNSSCMWGCQ
jgi:cysteine-rich repeat protein